MDTHTRVDELFGAAAPETPDDGSRGSAIVDRSARAFDASPRGELPEPEGRHASRRDLIISALQRSSHPPWGDEAYRAVLHQSRVSGALLGGGCQTFPPTQERRSDRFVFLSEIGGCGCLAEYLESLRAPPFSSGSELGTTVIIDQRCLLSETLTIPPGVTLRGCGIFTATNNPFDMSGSVLEFSGLGDNPAIRIGNPGPFSLFKRHPRRAVLRDLEVRGALGNTSDAIRIGRGNVHIANVKIAGWRVGIRGGALSRNVWIENVIIPGGSAVPDPPPTRTGILVSGGRGWRIRNVFIRDCLRWAIDVASGAGVVIEGGRFESNGKPNALFPLPVWLPGVSRLGRRGAIKVSASGVAIIGNYFEQNGWVANETIGTAVYLAGTSRTCRVLANHIYADAVAAGTIVVRALGWYSPDYPTYFDAGSAPVAALSTLVANGHCIAFNMDDAGDASNPYPGRFLYSRDVLSLLP